MTYTELYPRMLERRLIAPTFIRPLNHPSHIGTILMSHAFTTVEQLGMTWSIV
ncbi:hypothetical protein PTKIN_Ptkin15bG0046500 [Pterospermum kingtungense]